MTENITNVIRAIIKNEEAFSESWQSFSVVIGLDDEGDTVNSNGYLYKADGDFVPISADLMAVEEPVAAYLKDIYGDDKLPIKMLVQFDRLSGRYKTEFEDKDDSRWRVRPADINGYIEELRPKFDQ